MGLKKNKSLALASVALLVGRGPVHQTVAGAIPCQGRYWGFGLDSWQGVCAGGS